MTRVNSLSTCHLVWTIEELTIKMDQSFISTNKISTDKKLWHRSIGRQGMTKEAIINQSMLFIVPQLLIWLRLLEVRKETIREEDLLILTELKKPKERYRPKWTKLIQIMSNRESYWDEKNRHQSLHKEERIMLELPPKKILETLKMTILSTRTPRMMVDHNRQEVFCREWILI